MGLSALFEQHTKGWTVLGSFLVIILGGLLAYTAYWCHFKQGQEKMVTCFAARQRRREAFDSLPDDMEFLKAKVDALIDHTGLPDDEEEEDVEKNIETEADALTKDGESSDDGKDVGEEIQT